MSYRDHCTAGKSALNSPGHDRSGQRAGPAKPSAGPASVLRAQAAQGIGSVWHPTASVASRLLSMACQRWPQIPSSTPAACIASRLGKSQHCDR